MPKTVIKPSMPQKGFDKNSKQANQATSIIKPQPLDIPAIKFSSTSCYSFIARFTDDSLEIYFPPDAKIEPDFQAWLDKHLFTVYGDRTDVRVTGLTPKVKAAANKLLKAAKSNGAIAIDSKTKVSDLEDRLVQKQGLKRSPAVDLSNSGLVKTIVARISEVFQTQMLAMFAAFKQELIAENQKRFEEFTATQQEQKINSQKVKDLEAKLTEATQSLEAANTRQDRLARLLEEQALENKRLQDILGIDSDTEEQSPFEDEELDTTFLNSPFNKADHEITDPEEYDDTDYNKTITPARSAELPSFENSQKKIELEDIKLVDVGSITDGTPRSTRN